MSLLQLANLQQLYMYSTRLLSYSAQLHTLVTCHAFATADLNLGRALRLAELV